MRIEESPKRIRAFLGGRLVVDTLAARLVWEDRPYPGYWLPERDLRPDVAAALPAGALRRPADVDALAGYVHLPWDSADAWFEEDEEVYVHPRDPHTRVDILASSRRVRVSVDGVALADSCRARVLFETGLPPRWYVPVTDVRLELLRRSDTRTRCPYKGTAEYWSIDVGGRLHPDVAWTYRSPAAESQKIAGLVCFYDERVDVLIEGVDH